MQWNLRLRAAERGIWKSAEVRRMLAAAGLEISAGKMSSWWAGTPITMRLDDLDVLCSVLGCTLNDLMSLEPEKVAARRPRAIEAANGDDHAGHLLVLDLVVDAREGHGELVVRVADVCEVRVHARHDLGREVDVQVALGRPVVVHARTLPRLRSGA